MNKKDFFYLKETVKIGNQISFKLGKQLIKGKVIYKNKTFFTLIIKKFGKELYKECFHYTDLLEAEEFKIK